MNHKTTIAAVTWHHAILNEIHASRAARQLVGHHTFTPYELNLHSMAVGNHDETFSFGHLNWNKADQPRLIAATLAEMARQYPYINEEAA